MGEKIKHDLVVKHNDFIEAMTDLTLQQQRIVALVISKLPKKTELPIDKPYRLEIPVLQFAESFNISKDRAYDEIEKNQDILQNKTITLKKPDRRTKINLFILTDYLDGEGRIYVEIHQVLLPYLVNLQERFTSYRIKDVYQFTSANTWRMYELLAQYRQAGKRELTLDEIRWALGLKNKYNRPTELKFWVVQPAVRDINKMSDLSVQFETMKRGRRVTGYRFHIRTKSAEQFEKDMKQPAEQEERTPEVKEMVSLLMGYKVGGKQAGQLADSLYAKGKGLNWLQSKLPKMQADFNKLESQTTSLGGYIYKALQKELSGQLQMQIQEDSGSGKGADEQGQNYIRQAVSAVDKNSGPAKGGWGNLYDSDKQHYKDLARGEMIRIYGGEPPENLVEQRAKNIFNGK